MCIWVGRGVCARACMIGFRAAWATRCRGRRSRRSGDNIRCAGPSAAAATCGRCPAAPAPGPDHCRARYIPDTKLIKKDHPLSCFPKEYQPLLPPNETSKQCERGLRGRRLSAEVVARRAHSVWPEPSPRSRRGGGEIGRWRWRGSAPLTVTCGAGKDLPSIATFV